MTAASCMVGQSEALPMMMPTRGWSVSEGLLWVTVVTGSVLNEVGCWRELSLAASGFSKVESRGIEPLTSALPVRRSPS